VWGEAASLLKRTRVCLVISLFLRVVYGHSSQQTRLASASKDMAVSNVATAHRCCYCCCCCCCVWPLHTVLLLLLLLLLRLLHTVLPLLLLLLLVATVAGSTQTIHINNMPVGASEIVDAADVAGNLPDVAGTNHGANTTLALAAMCA
jgi:hypothetical protein